MKEDQEILSNTWGPLLLGVQALTRNPYDGHPLASAITLAEIMSDGFFDTVFGDHGYRGHDYVGAAEVHLGGEKITTRRLKRWLNCRKAIEAVIGHLKTDNGLDRNYLMGEEGDRINTILAGCGFNFRKVLIAIIFVFVIFQVRIAQI